MKLRDFVNPGDLIVDVAAAAVKKIRNRPKAVARRAAKAAREAPRQQPKDEIEEPFFNLEDQRMNWTLLIALAGSLLRHFLPWATALLAGTGISVSPDASPWLTFGLAVGVYLVMQAVSFYRQWQKNRAP